MKRVLFVLAVVFALALPAAAAAGPVTPDQPGASLNQPAATGGSTGYTLIAGGTGTAALTSERSHPSIYNKGSVKLATVTGDDRGMVRFEYAKGALKLDDLTTLSYWENVAARENPLDVFIDIWLDFNGDGVADASDYPGYLQAEPLYTVGAAPLNTWTQINAMTLKWTTYVGPDDPYNAPTIADFQANTVPTWTNNVDFGQLDILRVDVRVGYGGTWANFTGYADDIQINDYLEKFPLPSSNEINKTKGWGHVNQTAVGVGSTTLEFVSTRNFQSCFEYRTDGDTSQRLRDTNGNLRPNHNLDITDGLYPFVCVQNSTTSRTIAAREYVEVRLTFGAEGSERFDWTRSNVPSPVTAGDASWVFYDDGAPGGIGEFVAGPGTAPLGIGSVRLALPGTVSARQAYGTAAYAGTRLDAITKLNYFTYRSSLDAGNNLAIAIQFDMDYYLADTNVAWQGRLVFEPYMAAGGTVLEDVWQQWDALAGKWWASGAPGNTLCPQSSPCTWSQVRTNWPNAGLRATVGYLWLKAGGPADGFDGNVDFLTVGVNGLDTIYNFEPTVLKPTTTNPQFCTGETAVVKINLGPVNNLWAYELKVKYDEALVNAKGELDNSWFDQNNSGFAAAKGGDPCTGGICPFAKTELDPDLAVSGSGAVATVTFTGQAAGEFDVEIIESRLSTKDGAPISHNVSKLHLSVCGFASASGVVSLQGRETPAGTAAGDPPGSVTLTDGAFGPYSATIDPGTGAWRIDNIKVMPTTGTSYTIDAAHSLYLTSRQTKVLLPLEAYVAPNTKLLGGNADNSTGAVGPGSDIDITDLTCIANAFGGGPALCNGTGSTDINWDGATNIFDLAITGGNYGKSAPQPWQG